MKNRTCAVILLLLLKLATGAQPKPKITGFFSDMHYIAEAGDVIGTEVRVVYARGQYRASVQMAEGEPDPPVVVPVEVSDTHVKFTVAEHLVNRDRQPIPDALFKFEGIVRPTGLPGTVNSQL